MGVKVKLTDGEVELGGNFQSALSFVRGFTGRSHDPSTKTWTIPITLKEFGKHNSFPTEVLGSKGRHGRYVAGNHITKYGTVYSADEWDANKRAWKAEAEISSGFSGSYQDAESKFRQALAEIGVSQQGISVLVRNTWDLEEMVEFGRIKFASQEHERQVMAAVESYRQALEQTGQQEDDAIAAAQENIFNDSYH